MNNITIMKSDGSKETMSIIQAFRLEESGKDCIIYKDANNNYY